MSEWSLTPPGEVHEVDSATKSYHDFRSGYTFPEVRQELDVEARQVFELEGRRMFVTRATVLGRLHQHKQEAWRARAPRFGFDDLGIPEVPFQVGDLF